MLITLHKARKDPVWPTIAGYYRRRFFSPGHLAFLGSALVANVAWSEYLLPIVGSVAWRFPQASSSMMQLAIFNLFAALDLFAFALVIVVADTIGDARRNDLFDQLRLAGVSATTIAAPLFRLTLIAFLVDAGVEILLRVSLSHESAALRVAAALANAIMVLGWAVALATFILLLNQMRFGRTAQVLLVAVANYAVVSLATLLGETMKNYVKVLLPGLHPQSLQLETYAYWLASIAVFPAIVGVGLLLEVLLVQRLKREWL